MNKRTAAQQAFDQAKHGWAFRSPAMLRKQLPELWRLACQLSKDDERQQTMLLIERAAKGETSA